MVGEKRRIGRCRLLLTRDSLAAWLFVTRSKLTIKIKICTKKEEGGHGFPFPVSFSVVLLLA